MRIDEFRDLALAERARLLCLARRFTRDPHNAEDLVQKTYLKAEIAFRNKNRVLPRKSDQVFPFLYVIMIRILFNGDGHGEVGLPDPETLHASDARTGRRLEENPLDRLIDGENCDAVVECFKRLKLRERKVLAPRYWGGVKSFAVIGRSAGITARAAAMLALRALRKMRRCLKQKGIDILDV